MKNTIVIAIAVILLAVSGWAFSNYYAALPPDKELSVMKDRTDTFLIMPDTSVIFSLFEMDEHQWDRLRFRVQTISNYDYNPVYTAELPPSCVLFSNPQLRDKAIRKYKNDLKGALDSVNNPKNGLPNSSIYLPIIREVNRLAASKARSKILMIYSDLRENTPLTFLMYKNRGLLLKHADSVVQLLERLAKPADLHGVTVYLIFKPKTDQDNVDFNAMSGLFQKILEQAGAKVYIGTNVIPFRN